MPNEATQASSCAGRPRLGRRRGAWRTPRENPQAHWGRAAADQSELADEADKDRQHEDDAAVPGAAQQCSRVGGTIERDDAEQQRKPERNAAGQKFESGRRNTEPGNSRREFRLRRMRQSMVVGHGQKAREHQVGQAERKVDAEQPQTVEQQQHGGDWSRGRARHLVRGRGAPLE